MNATPSSYQKTLAAISLLILSLGVIAKPFAAGDESPWQFSLGIGAGVRTNPVMDNDDIPLIIIPQVSYEGEHFFVQNLDIGYRISQTDTNEFNLLLTPSYDQIFFNKWDISNFVEQPDFATISKNDPLLEHSQRTINKDRLHDRRMAGLAGVEYNQNFFDMDFQLQVLQEVTGYYDGSEIRFALSKSINRGKHNVKLTLGANWQNSSTVNYFYGLNEQASIDKFSYAANSGLTSLLRFDWGYELNDRWSLRFLTSYRHLSHSISESPLVTDNNVITAFAGGVYHF